MNILHHIVSTIGGEVVSRTQALVPGPGHSRSDRSLAVFLAPSNPLGFTCHSHAGDDFRACRDYVASAIGVDAFRPGRRWDDGQGSAEIEEARKRAAEAEQAMQAKAAKAQRIWREATPPSGTLVERYLASRGVRLPDAVVASDSIRFHAACPFRLADGSHAAFPAMVALITQLDTNQPIGIHRTALKSDGAGKLVDDRLGDPKRMLGPVKGGAIQLVHPADVGRGLGIAEGIEDGLTIMCAGWSPVWAAGSAGAVANFPVLKEIDSLTIFADRGRAGEDAAERCARRWVQAGRDVEVRLPIEGGDWNTVGRAA